ncbi:MAG: hypothetical protein LBQ74_02765 [Prevotella sp.]|nr:hypothetical protein [Prevotella sp.]
MSGYIKGRLILLDVRNDTNDFIHWRIKKYGLEDAVEFHDADAFNAMGICDGLFCIDVLEHLSNSSEIFIKRIDPLIKCGGFAILRAPWGGQLTHIDAARDNFYTAGGKEFLMRNYKEYYRFDANDIGAVYRKKGML